MTRNTIIETDACLVAVVATARAFLSELDSGQIRLAAYSAKREALRTALANLDKLP